MPWPTKKLEVLKIEGEKKEFLHREFCTSCFMAGFGMALRYPVYETGADREEMKEFLRNKLYLLQNFYKKEVKPKQHIENIEKLRKDFSEKYSRYLVGGEVSFGRMQKIVNLYLKYLWVSGIIKKEPPHCPIDSIVIAQLGRQFRGIRLFGMTRKEYEEVINRCKEKATESGYSKLKIAEWELAVFNKR